MRYRSKLLLSLLSAGSGVLALMLYRSARNGRRAASSNFSGHLRDAIARSREEALRLGHERIGTRHLLLGLAAVKEGRAAGVLSEFGCDLQELRRVVEGASEATTGKAAVPGRKGGIVPLTREAERALKAAHMEAKLLKSDVIGTEHLLLSVLRDKRGGGATLIKKACGATYSNVQATLAK